jgi:DNA-binding transcriptional MerR regulator
MAPAPPLALSAGRANVPQHGVRNLAGAVPVPEGIDLRTRTVYSQCQLFIIRSEIARFEREHPRGITCREVVALFESRGGRLSAPTFRKYVQIGLLPRSRRIGRKGKHTGSRGLYPASVVRRVDLIKAMMAEGFTLEDIRDSFVALKHRLEDVEGGWSALVGDVVRRARTHPARRQAERELARAEREMRSAVQRVERIAGTVAQLRAQARAGDGAA